MFLGFCFEILKRFSYFLVYMIKPNEGSVFFMIDDFIVISPAALTSRTRKQERE